MKTFATILFAAGASAIQQNDLEFLNYLAQHSKSYDTLEQFNYRLSNWIKTNDFINEETTKGLNYKLGHNKFSDWSRSEYVATLGYIREQEATEAQSMEAVDVASLPESVNWVTAGAVNPIQDQGQCGSCWSFSSCCAMEGIDQITNGTLRKFAEQQLVSCVKLCFGCNGGNFNTVFGSYAKKNALYSEDSWPYSATNGECTPPSSGVTNFKTSGLITVTVESETALKTQLATQPVSIAIQADQRVFQSYSSGVFDDERCGTALDHAVTLVGYGTEGGQEYYLMRNSWGSSWGENGYMKMGMNGDGPGVCGVQMDPVAPTTTKI
jgi:C1A family cysteine protease